MDFELDANTAACFHPGVSGTASFFKYWLPVILWMVLIFAGSTDLLSSQHTSRIIGPLLRWFYPDVSNETIRAVQAVVRKSGHVTEYSVLALLLWRARRKPVRNDSRSWSARDAVFAIVCAGIYAATDEFHQLFIPSRGPSVWDVLLDSFGAAVGIFLLWWTGRRRKLW